MSDPKPAFAAAPPSADLQEVEGLRLFLSGEAPLDGVWFGDKHPTLRGAFWWRTEMNRILRRLSQPAPTSEPTNERLVLWQHTWEFCPNCGNSLDTGNECATCGFDLLKFEATPPPPAGSRPEDAELVAELEARVSRYEEGSTPLLRRCIEALSRGKP